MPNLIDRIARYLGERVEGETAPPGWAACAAILLAAALGAAVVLMAAAETAGWIDVI